MLRCEDRKGISVKLSIMEALPLLNSKHFLISTIFHRESLQQNVKEIKHFSH